MRAFILILLFPLLYLSGFSQKVVDHSYFNRPYAGVKQTRGNRPLLVILMKPENDRFLENHRINVYGLNAQGHCQLTSYALNEKTGAPAGWYAKHSYTKMPTNIRFQAGPTVINHPKGDLQSVFATGTDGIVYQIYNKRIADHWVNWSSWTPMPANIKLADRPTGLNHSKGNAQIIFAKGKNDGYIYFSEFNRQTTRKWSYWTPLPTDKQFVSGPACLLSKYENLLSVFALGPDGVVYQCMRNISSNGGWGKWIPLPANQRLKGDIAAINSPDKSIVTLTARGVDNNIYYIQYLRKQNGHWTEWKQVSGRLNSAHSPALIYTADEKLLHVYATGFDGKVYVARKSFSPGAANTGPWSNWYPIHNGGDPFYSSLGVSPALHALLPKEKYREICFGAKNSIRDFYLENSYGKFTFDEAFISPWLTARDVHSTTHQDESSFSYLHGSKQEEKGAYVIQEFERQTNFNFEPYDVLEPKGVITEEELCIYWVYPGGDNARARKISNDDKPIKVKSLKGGIQLNYLVRGGNKVKMATIAHELGHQAFNLMDLYNNKNYPGVDSYSLMGHEGNGIFLDPWTKMKLGWLSPKVVKKSDYYTLLNSEKYEQAYILYNPDKGFKEYFIVENRWANKDYETTLPGSGLAVWHINENHDNKNDGNWGRKTINLVWAGGKPPAKEAYKHALFNANDPRTRYDLTFNSKPATTNWQNGSKSGFAISQIPAAGASMRIYIKVPDSLKE